MIIAFSIFSALALAVLIAAILKSGSDAEDYLEWEMRMRERDVDLHAERAARVEKAERREMAGRN
jgi:hypothetical protein